jgi:hypothetical protein
MIFFARSPPTLPLAVAVSVSLSRSISKLPSAQTCANCANMRKHRANRFVFAHYMHKHAQTCTNMHKHAQTNTNVCADDPIAKRRTSSAQTCVNIQNLAQTCANNAQTMHKHCANTAQTLRKHCANTAQTLRKHCANIAQKIHKPAQTCANIISAQTLCKDACIRANYAPTLGKHWANTAQTMRKHSANIVHCANNAQTMRKHAQTCGNITSAQILRKDACIRAKTSANYARTLCKHCTMMSSIKVSKLLLTGMIHLV